jgi:hypothetical protein
MSARELPEDRPMKETPHDFEGYIHAYDLEVTCRPTESLMPSTTFNKVFNYPKMSSGEEVR